MTTGSTSCRRRGCSRRHAGRRTSSSGGVSTRRRPFARRRGVRSARWSGNARSATRPCRSRSTGPSSRSSFAATFDPCMWTRNSAHSTTRGAISGRRMRRRARRRRRRCHHHRHRRRHRRSSRCHLEAAQVVVVAALSPAEPLPTHRERVWQHQLRRYEQACRDAWHQGGSHLGSAAGPGDAAAAAHAQAAHARSRQLCVTASAAS